MQKRIAVIIGAGPAGLTAALEMLRNSDITPIVIERDQQVGGISKTVVHNGNCMDIGGHRFFSKSREVMQWWLEILPLQQSMDTTKYVRQFVTSDESQESRLVTSDQTNSTSMLLRNRLSRILFGYKFYSYPVNLSLETLSNLGILKMTRIAFSYLYAQICPPRDTASLENFFISRFGNVLYKVFFKDYTEKVWGIPCSKIKSDWGAQRIKGLSIFSVIKHALASLVRKPTREVETSLIEKFLYPTYGPGQLWEKVEEQVVSLGGEVRKYQSVESIAVADNRITKIFIRDQQSNTVYEQDLDYLFSSMAIKDFIGCMTAVPDKIAEVAENLPYRDFITIGILLKKNDLKVALPDNWIYVQEPFVKLGRIQVFNNWSPSLVRDSNTIWLGLEYFTTVGDELWQLTDEQLVQLASSELVLLKLIDSNSVIDSKVIKVEKAYPMYSGSYEQFDTVKNFLNGFDNLFPIGRNGMHRYNNQDHSMLSAIRSVQCLTNDNSNSDKRKIWDINTEQSYQEDAQDNGDSA